MKKINFTKEWLTSFTANILGVIIGIVLTFGITFYVQHRQEKKQMREMVTLLKREIQDNKNWLKGRARMWNEDFESYWVVLRRQDWERIPKDSLDIYLTRVCRINISSSTPFVWNVFQSSGMLQNLHNVEAVAILSECYFWTEEMKTWWGIYNQKKQMLSDVYLVEYRDQPLTYFEALLRDERSQKVIDEMAYFTSYNFPQFYEQLAPLYDYALFMLENYDKPRKTKGLDFEKFKTIQAEQQTKPKQ